MDKLTIKKYPHPILQYKSKPVMKIDAELKRIVDEMFELMYETDGVGLAANQVGIPFQFFVMNASGDRENKEEEYVFLNPVIQKKKGKEEDEEGCLSFPEIRAPVIRAAQIELEGISLDGKPQRFTWKDFLARAVQHETDHLKGITFVDRLSEAAMVEVREQLRELEDEFETDQRLGLIPSHEEIRDQIAQWEKKW